MLSSTSCRLRFRFSGDLVVFEPGLPGVSIAVSTGAEIALLDCILFNSRLCFVRLSGSRKMIEDRCEMLEIQKQHDQDCF